MPLPPKKTRLGETRNNKNSHPTWYGTHRTVATPVQKFPFRPLDNRRCHDNHRSKPRRSAAAAITTEHPPTTPTPSSSSSYPEDAINRAFATLYDDIQALLHSELKLPMSSTPNPFRPPTPPTFRPARPKKRPTTSTTAPRRQPVERNRQARANGKYSAKLSPEPKPLLPTPTPLPPTHRRPNRIPSHRLQQPTTH